MKRLAVLTLAALMVLPIGVASAFASGGTPQPPPPRPQPTPPKSPAEQAIDHYNTGLKMRDKAWELEKKAEESADPKKKEKYLQKAQKQYEHAIREFRFATQMNAAFHQAHSSLGYALRKTGDYSAALAAYDQALALNPHYAQAIEYRGEAYLGLERVEDAKQAYVQLGTMDPELAGQLLTAMRRWIERRPSETGRPAAGTLEEFAAWVSLQEQRGGQKPAAAQGKGSKW